MTDNEIANMFESFAQWIRKGGSRFNDDAGANYETIRHEKVIERFVREIKSKNVSLDTITALTEKNANYIIAKLPIRNQHRKKTFWAVDVVKFCCDEWGIDYPPEYRAQCEKFSIAA